MFEGIETLRFPVAAFQWNKGTIGCLVQAGMYVDLETPLWLYELQGRRSTGDDIRCPSSQASNDHIGVN